MHRLIVNPGEPDAWAVELRSGINSIGRGVDNQIRIDNPAVSSFHCQISVNDRRVVLKDLGSTNGTFINQTAVVEELPLEPGQTFRLGDVQIRFETGTPAPAPTKPSLRVTSLRSKTESAPQETAEAPPLAPPILPVVQTSSANCRFHSKTPARWFCSKCQRAFCDLCVMVRSGGGVTKNICRSCGVECTPLEMRVGRTVVKGFFPRLPGAFIYPFRGAGVLILIASAFIFTGLKIASGGVFGFILRIIAMGYLFCFMQNILHGTAAEEEELPPLPGLDDIFGGFLRLAGTVIFSFGIAIGLIVARVSDVEIPMAAIIAAMIFGCIYFPMSFLAVAMKDNVMAGNPLVVIPSILKVPLEYIITVILLTSIFGIQRLGDIISGGAKFVSYSTTDMTVLFISFGIRACWSFLSVYLLTVNMRIMGLLYLTKKDKLGWFSH